MKLVDLLMERYRPTLVIKDQSYHTPFTYVTFKTSDGKDLGDSYLAYREKTFRNVNEGDPVFELHIQVDPSLQRKGYATEMIKTFLWTQGGVGYVSYGRITNDAMISLLRKLNNQDGFTVEDFKDDYFLIYE